MGLAGVATAMLIAPLTVPPVPSTPGISPLGSPKGDEAAAPATDAQDARYPFEAMKLAVGDRMQLQLPELLARERVIVRLIGYVSNLSILVTMPRQPNGLRFELLENDTVVVRVFCSQNAFGFSAAVAKVVRVPFEYLHLTFPNEVTGVVIRKAPRVRTRIICSVVGGQTGSEGAPGMLVNLSGSGALLDARRALGEKGETIKLSFRVVVHGVETLLTVNAVVRSCFYDDATEQGGAAMIHHGLEFLDLQPNDRLILQGMVYQQMIEHPKTIL